MERLLLIRLVDSATGHSETLSSTPGGGQPPRVAVRAGTRLRIEFDGVETLDAVRTSYRRVDGHLLVEVDGQVVVEIADFDRSPGAEVDAGSWQVASAESGNGLAPLGEATSTMAADAPAVAATAGSGAPYGLPVLGAAAVGIALIAGGGSTSSPATSTDIGGPGPGAGPDPVAPGPVEPGPGQPGGGDPDGPVVVQPATDPPLAAGQVSAADYGVVANSPLDQTAAIAAAIRLAAADGKELVFGSGVYLISGQITLPDHFQLTAATPGGAVFKRLADADGGDGTTPAKFHAGGWDADSITVTAGSLTGFILDGVQFDAFGRASGITVASNVFVNTPGDHQLYLGHGQFVARDNVFLNASAEQNSGLVAIRTYYTKDSLIEGNVIGGVNDHAELQARISDDARAMLAAIARHEPTLDLQDAGYFRSAAYFIGFDDNLRFAGNTMVGDEGSGYFRDHVIYGKQFFDLAIENNYFSGWPDDLTGGVKLRNGDGLLVAGNHFDDTELLTYSYLDMPLTPHLNNVYIVHNQFSHSGITYWENGGGLSASNFNVVDNTVDSISFLPQAWSEVFSSFHASGNVDALGMGVTATHRNTSLDSEVSLHRSDWLDRFQELSSPVVSLQDRGYALHDLIRLAVAPNSGQTLYSETADPELIRLLEPVALTLRYPGSNDETLHKPRVQTVARDTLRIDDADLPITDIRSFEGTAQLGDGSALAVHGALFTVRSGATLIHLLKIHDALGDVTDISSITISRIETALTIERSDFDGNFDVGLVKPMLTLAGWHQAVISEDGIVNAAESIGLRVRGSSTRPDGSVVQVSFSDGHGQVDATAIVTGGAWSLAATDVSGLSDGPITVSARIDDGQGGFVAVDQGVTKVSEPIDLAGHNPLLTGQLIHRIDANGKQYYLYDGNGDGRGGSGDPLTRNQLAALFGENADGSASGALDDSHRYRSFDLHNGGTVRLALLAQDDLAGLQAALAGKSGADNGWLFNGAATNLHVAGSGQGADAGLGDRWQPQSNQVVDVAGNANNYMVAFEVVALQNPPALTLSGWNRGVIGDDGIVNAAEVGSLRVRGTSTHADGATVTVRFADASQQVVVTTEVAGGQWAIAATDIRGLANGPVTVTAEVGAGADVVSLQQSLVKDDRIIDLAAGNPTLTGQLIHRIDADGKQYYLYDGNGDGSGGAGDPLTRNQLAALFSENADGSASGALDDSHRYRSFDLHNGGTVRLALLSQHDLAGLQTVLAGKTGVDSGWLFGGTATNMHLAGSGQGSDGLLGDRWQPQSNQVVDIAGNTHNYMTVFEVVDLQNPPMLTLAGWNQARIGDDGVINAAEAAGLRLRGTSTQADGTVIDVIISDGSQQVSATATVSGGQWALAPTRVTDLADGVVTVTASTSDGLSVSSQTQTLRKDSAAIDLAASNPTLTGQLIHRIDANGKQYYLYDGNGDGAGGSGDALSRNQLLSLFDENVDGSSTGTMDAIHRYQTFALAGGGSVRLAVLSQGDVIGLQDVLAGKSASDSGWLFNGTATNMHLAGSGQGASASVGDRWQPQNNQTVDVASHASSYMVVFELVETLP